MSERAAAAACGLALGLALCASGASGAATPTADALLARADAPRLAFAEGTIRVRATSGRGALRQTADLELHVQGRERVLCVVKSGRRAGRMILAREQGTWLILPRVRHPVPVAGKERLSVEAAYAELWRLRFADAFRAEILRTEPVDGVACHVLALYARDGAAGARQPFASGTLWVGTEDGLPRRARFALRSGREALELRFIAYRAWPGVGPGPLLARLALDDRIGAGAGGTTLDFLDYVPRQLPPAYFEPATAREALAAGTATKTAIRGQPTPSHARKLPDPARAIAVPEWPFR